MVGAYYVLAICGVRRVYGLLGFRARVTLFVNNRRRNHDHAVFPVERYYNNNRPEAYGVIIIALLC